MFQRHFQLCPHLSGYQHFHLKKWETANVLQDNCKEHLIKRIVKHISTKHSIIYLLIIKH